MEGPQIRTGATPVPLHYRGQITAQGLTALRRRLADWAVSADLNADTVDAIALCGYEALANAVEHAYPGQDGGLIELDTARVDQKVTVTVADHGQWQIAPTTPSQRGRGLVLIRGLSRAVIDSTDHGTTVTMTWLLQDS